MAFKNCAKCYWCKINYSYGERYMYKCKLFPSKRFNHSRLHGWLCKHFSRFREGIKHET